MVACLLMFENHVWPQSHEAITHKQQDSFYSGAQN